MFNPRLIYKKKHIVLITKKTVHRHCSSSILSSSTPPSAVPQAITMAKPPLRRPAHQSHRMIGHSTSAPITANGHKSKLIYCFQQPAAPPPQQLFVFGSKFDNHQRYQPHPSNSTNRNAPIHSALTFSNNNGSTGPHPAATPQTPPPLSSHRRAQAESRSPASCAVADSSGSRSQKLGKQENRSCKHN